ncbi:helix-hairpin-helix domain-containing protein [candidate division KSB1 bacterium]
MADLTEKQLTIRLMRQIPGVGKSIAEDLWDLGYRNVDDLREEDPQEMYDRFCMLKGMTVDRCVLYVYRCAVYYATNREHDPELLKWWNWKNRS